VHTHARAQAARSCHRPQPRQAYFRKGDYDWAIPDFDDAIQLDPEFADADNSRGVACEVKNDPDHAIADCNGALKLHP
jgi:tetratricopeptide (TPR) repeat protein